MRVAVPAVLPDSKKDFDEKLALLASIPQVFRIQIDVVDGRFASPASWPYFAKATQGTPYPELEAMAQRRDLLPHLDRIEYEIDLMCLDTIRSADMWLVLGASRLTFHAGSTDDLPRLIALARKRYGDIVSLGVALTVESDLALIERVVAEIDYMQFMGIARIGLQGQPFDERVLEKVRVFRARYPDIPVQIDGGVSLANARKLLAFGVTHLVVGSTILRARDPAAALAALEMCQHRYDA